MKEKHKVTEQGRQIHDRDPETHGINHGRETDFELERYKYILQQIHTSNDNVHKYLALFQTLITAIIGGGILIFVNWKNLNIRADIVRASIQGLIGLLIILASFVVISVIGGIFSWLDYRREEVKLLKDIGKPEIRKMPTLRNCWRWFETYVVLFIIVSVLAIIIFVEGQILPLVK